MDWGSISPMQRTISTIINPKQYLSWGGDCAPCLVKGVEAISGWFGRKMLGPVRKTCGALAIINK